MNRRVLGGIGVAVAGFGLGVFAMLQWSGLLVEPASLDAAHVATASARPSPTPTVSASPRESPSPSPTVTPFSKRAFLLDTPASPWVVVNKHLPLEPMDHVPPELMPLNGVPGGGADTMIPDAAHALTELYVAAEAHGAGFRVSTAYRSYNFQQGIYNDYVASRGKAQAEALVARPGFSEHQTGRAVDIYDTAACRLHECFADTAAGQFVAAHAHEYGFIIRYPADAQAITGYQFEPWHLRYVGVELATEMYTVGPYTMEEFFGLDAAPDYLD